MNATLRRSTAGLSAGGLENVAGLSNLIATVAAIG
jgi:hypothetical protein